MPDWLYQLLSAAAGAAGVYAGIRADLARLHEKAETAVKAADKAHDRIDQLISQRRAA